MIDEPAPDECQEFLDWAQKHISEDPTVNWPLLNGHDGERFWASLAWNAAKEFYKDKT